MANTKDFAELMSIKGLERPKMLHHVAYVTRDTRTTVDFYSGVLGLPLVSAVVDDTVPSTGDPFPYVHLFFALGDGSTVAFFESLEMPPPAEESHPAYKIFNHLALDVGSRENVDAWSKHLKDHGVEVVGPVDHKIIYSIYMYDPNGIRLELTATTQDGWQDNESAALLDVESWIEAKEQCEATGDYDLLNEWIVARRKRHLGAPNVSGPLE